MRSPRARAGLVALALTAALVVALLAMEAFDAPWLAPVVVALLVAP